MSAIHQYYYLHLVAIHNRLRQELKHCTLSLTALVQSPESNTIKPSTSSPSSKTSSSTSFDHLLKWTPLRTSLRSTLQFCQHLQTHHDIEEQVVFPAFAKVTDIQHWDQSHRELDETLDRIRKLARYGLMLDRYKTSYGGHRSCNTTTSSNTAAAALPSDNNNDERGKEEHEESDDGYEQDQTRHEQKFLSKKGPLIVQEFELLAKIVLPHLDDEEVMSTAEETVKLWPTSESMLEAFPWLA
ncbi:hypothetical protein BGZ94_008163 [Podila epigama]|nr:hypothetical protein BGZ94_008163 [Podila epigama]